MTLIISSFKSIAKGGVVRAILPVTSLSNNVQTRGIAGKTMRDRTEKKQAPFNYVKREFNKFWSYFSRISLMFDENSKIIVVDGAHGIGKSKFAKQLAEEFEMKYMPPANMDYFYKNHYGYDMRDYKDLFMDRVRPYDGDDFIRNPIGPVYGCADRFLIQMYLSHYVQYMDALMHVLNTGQGIVMERSPFSHHIYMDAAYNVGWVEKESRGYYRKMRKYTIDELLRPNLIIYLDAPVDVVQAKIKERGNEVDKNSPVWSNTDYLEYIYDTMKREYLQEQKKHSRVLVYDWTEPIDTETVVEDIERVNFDYFGQYEPQQADWRLYNEEHALQFRMKYSNNGPRSRLIGSMFVIYPDAEQTFLEQDEIENLRDVTNYIKGNKYIVGYNADCGDKNILFKTSMWQEMLFGNPYAQHVHKSTWDHNYLPALSRTTN